MANIARYNPFDELFNEFSKGFFVRPFSPAEGAEPKMKLDVKEDEKAYTVRAEMKQEKEEKKDEKLIYSERSYGMVSRSFSLPAEVDAGAAKAEYKDGVLNLVLPKKAGAQSRRLQVS